jgi:LPXTG-motif cell wall-anchored protein
MLLVTDQSIWPAEAQQQETTGARRSAGALADLAWVLGYFAVAGAVAGFVWWKLATPAYYTRTGDNAVMLQSELGQRVQGDGWFVVVGLVAALLGGVVLTRWRRHPLLVVLVGYAASLAGGILALALGRMLGHQDVAALAKTAAVGSRFPDSLDVISPLVVVAWPIGFLIGSVVVIWGSKAATRDVPPAATWS